MDLDELRAVQNKERQKDSLQHLRESFYADVAEYVSRLEQRRDEAAEAADKPFASPEVRRLTDEIETAREVAEAVYERRLGKLVKRASLAAADMPADADGLTAEEEELFDDLVERIERNKDRVLEVVDGETAAAATATEEPGPDPDRDATGVAASDAMGGTNPAEAQSPDPATGTERTDQAADEAHPGHRDTPAERADPEPPDEPGATPSAAGGNEEPPTVGTASDGGATDDRTTVRITDDVGEIFGVDDRDYDLSAEDVVTLPAANAEPLLERDAAERLD